MKVLITLLVLMVAMAMVGAVQAGEPSVKIITADTGFRIDGGGSFGPQRVAVSTDGDATIKFLWLKKDGTLSAGGVSKLYPSGADGTETAFPVRAAAAQPQGFIFSGSGPDSCYVDVSTAGEVIVSW